MTFPAVSVLAKAIRIDTVAPIAAPTDYTQYFTFDNVDATTIFDEVGSNDITITGTADYEAGVDGDGLKKDSHTPSYHGLDATNAFMKEFSVSFWVKEIATLDANNGSGFGVITTIGTDFSTQGLIIDVSETTGAMRFLVGNSGGFVTCPYGASGSADVRDGTRHHIVLTVQFNDPSSEMFAYFDGAARPSATALTNFVAWTGGVLTFLNRTTTTWSLAGLLIDEFKFFDYVLSQGQVTAIRNLHANAPFSASAVPNDFTDSVSSGSHTTASCTVTVSGGIGPFLYSWASDGVALTADSPNSATTTFTGDRTNFNTTETLTCTVTDQGDGDAQTTAVVTTDITWAASTDYILYYTMDDISGLVLLDDTANNHDATMLRAMFRGTGVDGLALTFVDFPTSYQVGTIVDHANLKPTEMSVAFWNRSTPGGIDARTIFQSYNKRSDGAGGEIISGLIIELLPSGAYTLTVGSNTGDVQGTDWDVVSTIIGQVNIFDHIVLTYEGTTLQAYINSVLSATTAYSGGLGYHTDNRVRIGASDHLLITDETINPHGGNTDEFKFYNRIISQGEVDGLFSQPPAFNVVISPAQIVQLKNPSSLFTSSSITTVVGSGVGPFTYKWTRIVGSTLFISGSDTGSSIIVTGQNFNFETTDVFECEVTDTGNGDATTTDTISIIINWDAV